MGRRGHTLHLSNNTTIKANSSSTPEPVAKTVEFHGGSFYYIVKGDDGTKFHLYDLDKGSNADKSYMWVCVSELVIAVFATILTCCCGGCCTGIIAFVAGIMGIAASVYVSGFAEDTWGLNVTDSENEWALYVHAFGSAFFTLTAIIMCCCDPKYGTTIVAKRVTTFVRN